jgi:hypothetical protein
MLVVVVGALVIGNDRTTSTLANGLLLLMIGLIPPAIMLIVWRGPPALTVAEVLHGAGKLSEEDRR